MGKFATLIESGTIPQKREFVVHAKDGEGKSYKFNHEGYSPRSVHKDPRFDPAEYHGSSQKPHALVKITHDGKDVTNESTQVDEKVKLSTEDHANVTYHTKMAQGHKEQAAKHYEAGKTYSDPHRIASLYHNGAAAEHEYAAKAHQEGSVLKHQYSDHARERTSIANDKSAKAKSGS